MKCACQLNMMMSWPGNTSRIPGPLWGESPHRGLLMCILMFPLLLVWTKLLNKQWRVVIRDTMMPMWCHCNENIVLTVWLTLFPQDSCAWLDTYGAIAGMGSSQVCQRAAYYTPVAPYRVVLYDHENGLSLCRNWTGADLSFLALINRGFVPNYVIITCLL